MFKKGDVVKTGRGRIGKVFYAANNIGNDGQSISVKFNTPTGKNGNLIKTYSQQDKNYHTLKKVQ